MYELEELPGNWNQFRAMCVSQWLKYQRDLWESKDDKQFVLYRDLLRAWRRSQRKKGRKAHDEYLKLDIILKNSINTSFSLRSRSIITTENENAIRYDLRSRCKNWLGDEEEEDDNVQAQVQSSWADKEESISSENKICSTQAPTEDIQLE